MKDTGDNIIPTSEENIKLISDATLVIPYAVRNFFRRASSEQLSCMSDIQKADAIIKRIDEKASRWQYPGPEADRDMGRASHAGERRERSGAEGHPDKGSRSVHSIPA